MNRIHCKYHPEAELVEDYKAGDLICPVCGLVVADRIIDFSSEWRSFADDTVDQCRVGAIEGSGHVDGSSSIGIQMSRNPKHCDDSGNAKYKSHHLTTPAQRWLNSCSEQVRLIGERLKAGKNVESQAILVLKKMSDNQQIKKKSKHDVLATAALHLAFKSRQVPRSIKELCEAAQITKKELHKVNKRLRLMLPTETLSGAGGVGSIRADEYVQRFVSLLKLEKMSQMPVERVATCMAKHAYNVRELASKNPLSIASTAIYMATQLLGVTTSSKAIIAYVCGSSETTITGLYKLFYPNRFSLLPRTEMPDYAEKLIGLPES